MKLHTTTRFASLAFAFVFTFGMLAGVNGLATSDATPHGQLATTSTVAAHG